jgi:hypothetical protein
LHNTKPTDLPHQELVFTSVVIQLYNTTPSKAHGVHQSCHSHDLQTLKENSTHEKKKKEASLTVYDSLKPTSKFQAIARNSTRSDSLRIRFSFQSVAMTFSTLVMLATIYRVLNTAKIKIGAHRLSISSRCSEVALI